MTSTVSRGRTSWPYALKSPKNSVGTYRGILYSSFLGDILCWDAQGEAQRLFDCETKPTIIDFLKDNSSRIQESDSFLLLTLFMVGKRPERSKPTVMFVGDDKAARKEAFDLVKESDIMSSYPGFELGHTGFGKVMALAGELVTVFSTRESRAGCRQLFCAPTGTEQPRKATAGGIVIHRGKHMFLTVNHFLDDASVRSVAKHNEEEEEIPDCEITGLSDFEDDDSDVDTADVTSQGSLSDESESEDMEKNRSTVSSDSTFHGQGHSSPTQTMWEHPVLASVDGVEVGKVVLRSRELDYALVEADADAVKIATRRKDTLLLDDTHLLEREPREAAVKTRTSGSGTIGGTMSSSSHHLRLPGSKAFTEVYMARFSLPLHPGDCGSWVRDAVTGRFFGHIIAGSPIDGLTVIMPARAVFEHASSLLTNTQTLVQLEDRAIPSTFNTGFWGIPVSYPSGNSLPFAPFDQSGRRSNRPPRRGARSASQDTDGDHNLPSPSSSASATNSFTPVMSSRGSTFPATSPAATNTVAVPAFFPFPQPYQAPTTLYPGYQPSLQAANSFDSNPQRPLGTASSVTLPTLVSALIRNLPLSTSEESLRLMMVFSTDLVGVVILPIEQAADRFRCAILKFKSLAGAQEAKNMLDGKPNISHDAEMIVEIHLDSSSSTSPKDAILPPMVSASNPWTPHQLNRFPPETPPCNTLYIGNLPVDTSEEELKDIFSKQPGYKRLYFRTKQNGPICFVEFEDVTFATKALYELYGQPLHNSVKGGIRLSFSKSPLGVRSGPNQGRKGGDASRFAIGSGPPPGLSGSGMYDRAGMLDASGRHNVGGMLDTASTYDGGGRLDTGGIYDGNGQMMAATTSVFPHYMIGR